MSASSDNVTSPTEKRVSRRVTNADILKILQEKTPFYDLYVRLTNRAIDFYVKAGRRKFALRLHGSLAALDLYVWFSLLYIFASCLSASDLLIL